ncbi:MAG: glycine--tRNA ligase subunit beta [Deltaproteobacteria bacterium]|nr:glycine--tRNA ligase subunit beta [Deltaproteobacteria bacterium]
MPHDFLLEIGMEEIPAGFLTKAYTDLATLTAGLLERQRLSYETIRIMGTPRRLAVYVSSLADRQEDRVIENLGPSRKVAYDAEGKPTKAAVGFARGQGIDLDQLEIATTEKGDYLCARKKETGLATVDILAAALPGFVQNIPFRKSMRWKDLDLRFARPVHWLLALFGKTVIPFDFGELQSENCSHGHRFMAPGPFAIDHPAHYLDLCRQAKVIVDPTERKAMIKEQLLAIEQQVDGTIIADDDLLETVTNLVEYPDATCGTFEEQFLRLPDEVLITVMRHHQKYFSIRNRQGELMPHFVTINNTVAHDRQLAIAGNERVLRARLNDANFFYQDDLKVDLESFVERLKNVVFQAKLGTSYEKMTRFRSLAEDLAVRLCPAKKERVSRTALLCKADLESSMVYEFADLQGIMGREYARAAKEHPDVSRGIYEHYLPVAAGGALPTEDCGALVSIADKIDTIVGCFGIGLLPTGGADPYALRRQALGIIHIISDRQYELDLSWLVEKSLVLLAEKIDRPAQQVAQEVLEFIKGRLFNNLTAKGIPAGVVEAVLHDGVSDLVEAGNKIAALDLFRHRDDFELLLVAFKRVMNIIKDASPAAQINEQLFEEEAEQQLHQAFLQIDAACRQAIADRDYPRALATMAELKPTVDQFFDQVMVMAEDETVKKNRLALLQAIATMFKQVADFARL